MPFKTITYLLCLTSVAAENDGSKCALKEASDLSADADNSLSFVQLKAQPSPSHSESEQHESSHQKSSTAQKQTHGSASDRNSSSSAKNGGGPQWVLVTGDSKADMSDDPYYSLLRANKEWAAESLGMSFKHYWAEELVPTRMNKYCKYHGCGANETEKTQHFAKIFMVQDAMHTHPGSEFILFMDSSDAWFNPRIFNRFDKGKLMKDIAARIPEEKHFIFTSVHNLGLGVFVVRNSAMGRQLVDQWAEISSGPRAPKCQPWDHAALFTLFLETAAKYNKDGLKSEYNCHRSCQEAGCVVPFEEELRAFKLMKFSAGYQNSKVPFFHVFTPRKGIPRLQCVRCQHAEGPITLESTSVKTLLAPGEDKFDSDVPWLINHGGTGQASRTLFAKTSGVLQCDKPSKGGKPSAIVAGVSKGATTSIHMYLGEHPDVGLPKEKEAHFFDRGEREGNYWQHVHDQIKAVKSEGSGFSGFRKHVQHACEQYFERFPQNSHSLMLDSTPDYSFNPHAAEWISHMFPNMKIIMSLRDPAKRAFSEWQMWNTRDSEGKDADMPRDSFSAAAQYAIKKVESCLSAHGDKKKQSDKPVPPLKDCVENYSGEQDITHGLYLLNLLPWMTNFPKKQVFVLRYEDFEKNTGKEMMSMAKFLGLDSAPKNFSGWDKVTHVAYANASSQGKSHQAILREGTVSDQAQGLAELCTFYKKENQYLATALGMTLSWCGHQYDADSSSGEAVAKALCRGLTDAACKTVWDALRVLGWREPSDQQEYFATPWPESRESLWLSLVSTSGAHRRGWFCPEFNGKHMLEKYKFTPLLRQFGGRDSVLRDRLTVIPRWRSVYVTNGKLQNTDMTELLRNKSLTGSPRAYSIELEEFKDDDYFYGMRDTKAFSFVGNPTTLVRAGFAEMLDAAKNRKEGSLTKLQASDAKWTFVNIDPYKHPQRAFEAYLQDLVRLKKEGRLGRMLELPENSFAIPQWTRMFYEDGPNHHIAMDFVGKFENLEQDFQNAQRQLDVPLSARVQWPGNPNSARLESSSPLKALLNRVNLTSQANRSIAEVFQEDFRCFGYPVPRGADA